VSAASAWEIAVKFALGKLPLPEPPAAWLPDEVAANGFTPLPISVEHALAVAELPRHHADPFDRLLIAQAKAEQLAVVSSDDKLAAYDVDVIRC
jgi:PIN domain nuclease of toxin-antitoxin system